MYYFPKGGRVHQRPEQRVAEQRGPGRPRYEGMLFHILFTDVI